MIAPLIHSERMVRDAYDWLWQGFPRDAVDTHLKSIAIIAGYPRYRPSRNTFAPHVFSATELRQVRSPVLLLIGDHEVIYHPDPVIRRAARLVPDLKAEIVPNANHCAQLPERNSDLLYFLVPFIPAFTNLIPGVEVSNFSYLLAVLAITLMVGFVEEGLFRGLMLHPMIQRGLWKAVLFTALLFGVTHALNMLAGKSLAEDLAQIYFALAIGFAFAVLVLKTGILWPLILAHWSINFVNFIQKPHATNPAPWNVVVPVSLAVIFTVYGIYVMLRYKPVTGRVNIDTPVYTH